MADSSIQPIDHDTPVEEEIALHRKGWTVQRVGWVLMLVFLVAALLGLFGEGILSRKTIRAGNLELVYERFCRYEHRLEMKLLSAGEHINVVSLPKSYLEKFKIDKIVPAPSSEVANPGYVSYLFNGNKNDTVSFYMAPLQRGSTGGLIKINNQTVPIQQYIYP